MRLSVRELLAIVAFIAVAMGSLLYGGLLAKTFLLIMCVFLTALLIIASVARDKRQAFAIGFIIPFAAYVAIHYVSDENELDPFHDRSLPTTRGFATLFDSIVARSWIEYRTDRELSGFALERDEPPEPGIYYRSESGIAAKMIEYPRRSMFALVGHCVLASIIGYIGGKFAMFIRASDRADSRE